MYPTQKWVRTPYFHAPVSPPFSIALSAQIGDGQYPPQSAQNLTPKDVSNFVDGSGPIFSMYMEMATEEDKKMVEDWKADADGILIFVRLILYSVTSHQLNDHRPVYSPLL